MLTKLCSGHLKDNPQSLVHCFQFFCSTFCNLTAQSTLNQPTQTNHSAYSECDLCCHTSRSCVRKRVEGRQRMSHPLCIFLCQIQTYFCLHHCLTLQREPIPRLFEENWQSDSHLMGLVWCVPGGLGSIFLRISPRETLPVCQTHLWIFCSECLTYCEDCVTAHQFPLCVIWWQGHVDSALQGLASNC